MSDNRAICPHCGGSMAMPGRAEFRTVKVGTNEYLEEIRIIDSPSAGEKMHKVYPKMQHTDHELTYDYRMYRHPNGAESEAVFFILRPRNAPPVVPDALDTLGIEELIEKCVMAGIPEASKKWGRPKLLELLKTKRGGV